MRCKRDDGVEFVQCFDILMNSPVFLSYETQNEYFPSAFQKFTNTCKIFHTHFYFHFSTHVAAGVT